MSSTPNNVIIPITCPACTPYTFSLPPAPRITCLRTPPRKVSRQKTVIIAAPLNLLFPHCFPPRQHAHARLQQVQHVLRMRRDIATQDRNRALRCRLCDDDLDTLTATRLDCGHEYHTECVSQAERCVLCNEQAQTCNICLLAFTAQDGICRLNCGHGYHTRCLDDMAVHSRYVSNEEGTSSAAIDCVLCGQQQWNLSEIPEMEHLICLPVPLRRTMRIYGKDGPQYRRARTPK